MQDWSPVKTVTARSSIRFTSEHHSGRQGWLTVQSVINDSMKRTGKHVPHKESPGKVLRALSDQKGIGHIAEDQRHGREIDQFTMRFSPVIYLAPVVLAAAGIPLGLGLSGSISAILAGNFLGSIATAACATMGPRLGMPQVAMTRSAFGYVGNYLPAFLGILLFVGYFSLGTALGAKSLASLIDLPYAPVVLIVSAASVLIAIFGYHFVQLLGRWITRVSIVVFAVVSIFLLVHGVGTGAQAKLSGGGYLLVWLLEFTVVFSYTVSWTIYASDYSRYLPADSKFLKMLGWAFAGTFLSTSWMMILGAALATLASGADVLAGFAAVLPVSVLKIVLITFVIGALSHNAVNLYSGSMASLTCDLPLKRATVVLLGGVFGSVLALFFGGTGFQQALNTFLVLVSYFTLPWLAILCVDFFWNRGGGRRYPEPAQFYRRHGVFKGARWQALVSFFAGVIVSVPFMATDAYTGPIGHRLGGVDFSYFISFAAAATLFRLLRAAGSEVESEPSVAQGDFRELGR